MKVGMPDDAVLEKIGTKNRGQFELNDSFWAYYDPFTYSNPEALMLSKSNAEMFQTKSP
jgi:hypothetical protein